MSTPKKLKLSHDEQAVIALYRDRKAKLGADYRPQGIWLTVQGAKLVEEGTHVVYVHGHRLACEAQHRHVITAALAQGVAVESRRIHQAAVEQIEDPMMREMVSGDVASNPEDLVDSADLLEMARQQERGGAH